MTENNSNPINITTDKIKSNKYMFLNWKFKKIIYEQDRANNLAIISIKKTISKTLNYKDAIKRFIAIKAQRVI